MGNELVSDSFSVEGDGREKSVPVSFSREFDKCLPYHLAIGMTPEQYWDGDCELARHYRKAHEIRREENNFQAWLQGLYYYEALCDVSPVLHAFAQKGTKVIPYPSEPYAFSEKERKKREERLVKERFEKMKQKSMSWALRVNAYFANRR